MLTNVCLNNAYWLLTAITSFEEARRSDLDNERLPPTSRSEFELQERKKQERAIAQAVEDVDKDPEIADIAEAFVKDDEKRRSLKEAMLANAVKES